MIPHDPLRPHPVVCPRCGGRGTVDDRYRLSPTEIAVLQQVSRGFTIKESSRRMGRSEQTLKNHLTSVYRKLGVSGIQQAIYVIWLREHLGDPPGYLPDWP